jgi:hypothetical protein
MYKVYNSHGVVVGKFEDEAVLEQFLGAHQEIWAHRERLLSCVYKLGRWYVTAEYMRLIMPKEKKEWDYSIPLNDRRMFEFPMDVVILWDNGDVQDIDGTYSMEGESVEDPSDIMEGSPTYQVLIEEEIELTAIKYGIFG